MSQARSIRENPPLSGPPDFGRPGIWLRGLLAVNCGPLLGALAANHEALLEESLTDLETDFSGRFLRIHRDCLVARGAVTGVERTADEGDGKAHWQVILDGIAERLPVSRRQWSPLKALLGLGGQMTEGRRQ